MKVGEGEVPSPEELLAAQPWRKLQGIDDASAVAPEPEENLILPPPHMLQFSTRTATLPRPLSDHTATYIATDGTSSAAKNGRIRASSTKSSGKIYNIGGCDAVEGYIRNDNGGEAVESSLNMYCPHVSHAVTEYDIAQDDFVERARMTVARLRHSATAIGDKIWIVGGRDRDDNIVAEVDVYDTTNDTWATMGTLPPELLTSDHAAFAIDNMLFVVGGYNDRYEATRQTYRIDTLTTHANAQISESHNLAIDQLPHTHLHRAEVQAVVSGSKAYLIGGFSHEDGYCHPFRSVEVLDTAQEERGWSYAPGKMNTGRANSAVVTFDNKFFVLGGETRTDENMQCHGAQSWEVNQQSPRRFTYPVRTVEMYDPTAEASDANWHFVSGPGLPADKWFRFAAETTPSHNNEIFVFGGAANRDSTVDAPQEVIINGRRIQISDGLALTNSMGVYSDNRQLSAEGGRMSAAQFAQEYRILGITMLAVGSASILLAVMVAAIIKYRRTHRRVDPIRDDAGGGASHFVRTASLTNVTSRQATKRPSGSLAFL